jgi:3-oxoacyl-[acyl-carrier-protein] synthase II
MKYINSYSGINRQNALPNQNDWVNDLSSNSSGLELPNFKEHIQGVQLRRLSKVLKMSLACAQFCKSEMTADEMAGIIIATGLGCLEDTRKFMVDVNAFDSPSPTPFIHSTHNTIAGQLGLHMKCHGYNITHANVGACLENALLDAYLQPDQGWYLVGAVDEKIDWLQILMDQAPNMKGVEIGEGSTFLAISSTPSSIELEDVGACYIPKQQLTTTVVDFLGQNEIGLRDVDLVLHNGTAVDGAGEQLNYQNYCGAYFTNSGFGIEFGIQKLKSGLKRVLVVNTIRENQIGLTLLKHV